MFTLDALVRVRECIPDIFSQFIPTQAMYDLFNTDMYKTKVQELRDNTIAGEEISFLTETEIFLRELELLEREMPEEEFDEDESDEEDQVEADNEED